MTTVAGRRAQVPAFELRVRDVWSDLERLHVLLVDGREIAVPLAWLPRLADARPDQRARWELLGRGAAIHWEELDEDISVAGLLGLPD